MSISVQRAVIVIPATVPECCGEVLVGAGDILRCSREVTQSTEVIVAIQSRDAAHLFRILYPAFSRQIRAYRVDEETLCPWEYARYVTAEIPSDGRLTIVYLFLDSMVMGGQR